nr:hypothetical protein [Tanacetum cinerariifolium]
ERLKREYHSIRQTDTETSTEFMQRFLRLAGFHGAAVGTEEEQAKNFERGLRRSTLNHLMCIQFTDVAQVANAACNDEILHERDDDDAERPDKRQKSGDRHQPTTQQSSHRNYCHNNDRIPIRAEIREEFRTNSGPSDAGGNPPPATIHTWLERFNKQNPHSFEKATAPFEGNVLAWWKAYKQAKGGDACLITVTWADFKKLFFLQFFPRAEQERLKREYHSIHQKNTETSTEFMQCFLRLAGFLGAAAGTE